MSNKSIIYLGAGVGGTVGGFVPGLWGASDFSGWGIFLSTVGGLLGVWIAYKFLTS